MKKGFADPDTGERMFRYSKHMKGCMMLKSNMHITQEMVDDSGWY